MKYLHNIQTNEIEIRELTNDEKLIDEIQRQQIQDSVAAQKVIEAEKMAARNNLLAKLGITEDEAKLLLS